MTETQTTQAGERTRKYCYNCGVAMDARGGCGICKPLKNHLPEIRIDRAVPEEVLTALADQNRKQHYSELRHVFYCIWIGPNHWVGVAGDGDNGAYEHFVMRDGKLTCTDVGYGCTEVALRDILNEAVPK